MNISNPKTGFSLAGSFVRIFVDGVNSALLYRILGHPR
jgi:hypothetical protein